MADAFTIQGRVVTEAPEVIRGAVVNVRHSVQSKRAKNKTHFYLFDQIDTPRLKRVALPLSMQKHGGFVCGRKRDQVEITYSSDKLPKCLGCLSRLESLIKQGFSIRILNQDQWNRVEIQQSEILTRWFFKIMKEAGDNDEGDHEAE